MSQNETTTVLVTDAKNLTLIDATRENSPWCKGKTTTVVGQSGGKGLIKAWAELGKKY